VCVCILTANEMNTRVCTEQVGIGGDQVPSNQLGRSEPHHAGLGQQPHGPVLATKTAVPATAFLISRPSNPVSTIVPPAMQHASVVLDHDQFHVPAILLHHHDKFQVTNSYWLFFICFMHLREKKDGLHVGFVIGFCAQEWPNDLHACFLS
jgi:hypothetical protein